MSSTTRETSGETSGPGPACANAWKRSFVPSAGARSSKLQRPRAFVLNTDPLIAGVVGEARLTEELGWIDPSVLTAEHLDDWVEMTHGLVEPRVTAREDVIAARLTIRS